MNRTIGIVIGVFIALVAMGALYTFDYRSGTAKAEMDKFSGTPTPSITPTPEATPIDPADIVQVDTSIESNTLTVNGHIQKQTVNCTKYDRVYVNGSGTTAMITGACRQIMVNGDKDQITADAVTEFVFNGTGNSVTYSRFVNGKVPSIVENMSGNDVAKLSFSAAQKDQPKSKAK
jgi:hypothetical protein